MNRPLGGDPGSRTSAATDHGDAQAREKVTRLSRPIERARTGLGAAEQRSRLLAVNRHLRRIGPATAAAQTAQEPLRVVGPSSTLELNGTLDIAREQIDAWVNA